MDKGYIIELYDKKKHDIEDFDCGIEILNKYLKEKAGQETRKKVAAVYVTHKKSSSKIIGFYTLSSYSVELTSLPQEIVKKLPKYKALPAILMGRFAIDKEQQGKKIGEFLLIDALVRSYKLSQQIGSIAVVVDAKNENAKSFYVKFGFKPVKKQPLKLFLPTATIEKLW